jgi:TusA-related sulfurtransferase
LRRPARFKTTLRVNVPKGRNSKHRTIVARILSELKDLKDGSALEIPLKDLPDSKENIRSALSRASGKAGLKVATSSDDGRLFIWNMSE